MHRRAQHLAIPTVAAHTAGKAKGAECKEPLGGPESEGERGDSGPEEDGVEEVVGEGRGVGEEEVVPGGKERLRRAKRRSPTRKRPVSRR